MADHRPAGDHSRGQSPFLAALALPISVAAGWRCRSWRPVVLALVCGGGVPLVLFTAKALVGRNRPPLPFALVDADGYSFPSGHATGTAAIMVISAWMLTRWLIPGWTGRVMVWAVAIGSAFLIGFSRVYLGVHYVSDVLSGWMLGMAWAGTVMLVGTWWDNTRRARGRADNRRREHPQLRVRRFARYGGTGVAGSRSPAGTGVPAVRLSGTTPAQCGSAQGPADRRPGAPLRTLADTSTRSSASTPVAASSRGIRGPAVGGATGRDVIEQAIAAPATSPPVVDHARVTHHDDRAEVHRMVHRGARQHQPVDQGDGDAHRQARPDAWPPWPPVVGRRRSNRAGRASRPTCVRRRQHHRPAGAQVTQMADQRLVEDVVDGAAVVACALPITGRRGVRRR